MSFTSRSRAPRGELLPIAGRADARRGPPAACQRNGDVLDSTVKFPRKPTAVPPPTTPSSSRGNPSPSTHVVVSAGDLAETWQSDGLVSLDDREPVERSWRAALQSDALAWQSMSTTSEASCSRVLRSSSAKLTSDSDRKLDPVTLNGILNQTALAMRHGRP
jgi:hypothetical protein